MPPLFPCSFITDGGVFKTGFSGIDCQVHGLFILRSFSKVSKAAVILIRIIIIYGNQDCLTLCLVIWGWVGLENLNPLAYPVKPEYFLFCWLNGISWRSGTLRRNEGGQVCRDNILYHFFCLLWNGGLGTQGSLGSQRRCLSLLFVFQKSAGDTLCLLLLSSTNARGLELEKKGQQKEKQTKEKALNSQSRLGGSRVSQSLFCLLL